MRSGKNIRYAIIALTVSLGLAVSGCGSASASAYAPAQTAESAAAQADTAEVATSQSDVAETAMPGMDAEQSASSQIETATAAIAPAQDDGSAAEASGTSEASAEASSDASLSDKSVAAAGSSSDSASSDTASSTDQSATAPVSVPTPTPEPSRVSFVCFGDDLLHLGIVKYGLQVGSYDSLFAHLTDETAAADIAVLNQETPVTTDPSRYSGYPQFGSPVSVIDAVANAGFNVITCATNHAIDQGWSGIQALTDKVNRDYGGMLTLEDDRNTAPAEEKQTKPQLMYLGVNKDQAEYDTIKTVEKNGMTIAMLNYTYGTNGIPIPKKQPWCVDTLGSEQKVREDIRRAHELADAVVVFVHWGTEYRYKPDDSQKRWADVFTQEDVDVVVGGHPHVVEPYEMKTNTDGHQTLVFYSDGNLISTQKSVARCLGGSPRFTLEKTEDGVKVVDYTMEPVITHRSDSANVTAYMLKDYTNALGAKHVYHITTTQMQNLFDSIMAGTAGTWEKN